MGHEVEKFSWEDAYPSIRLGFGWWRQLFGFKWRVEAMLRSSSGRFDVVDAHQGNLTRPKQELGLQGVVAIRSAGLVHLHAALDRTMGPTSGAWRSYVGALRRRLSFIVAVKAAERSFDAADRILLPNETEMEYVQVNPSWGGKARLVPNAISRSSWAALSDLALPTSEGMGGSVACIGSWGRGKGSREWPKIVRKVWSLDRDAQFLFLGTRVDEERVRVELQVGDDDKRIKVISEFRPRELPDLLSRSSVGAFPSHLEGFGLGVLEMLAAGRPVVAFDAPGPRQLLLAIDPGLLVPIGDADQMATRLVELLQKKEEAFRDLAIRCRNRAESLTWCSLAQRTLDAYELPGKARGN